MGTDAARQEVVDLVVGVLRGGGLDADVVGDGRVMTMLSGDHKRTIPVLLEVGDRSLRLQSLFTGVLDEGHGEVYATLLHRNERARHVHFALDDEGDLLLVGRVPLAALDAELLGEVLGELLVTADETFDVVLRTGFAGYLAGEQAWRRGAGLAPNPIGDPLPGRTTDQG